MIARIFFLISNNVFYIQLLSKTFIDERLEYNYTKEYCTFVMISILIKLYYIWLSISINVIVTFYFRWVLC